jgi:lipoprotein signal peptidase
MMPIARIALMALAALGALLLDVATKATPHDTIVNNYSHTPAALLVLVAVFLCILGTWHSNTVAIGAGLMFGGLLGNGGQILLYGYASDWIPLGGWLTNVADLSGGAGLLCCLVGYVLTVFRRAEPANVPQSSQELSQP